ncbi:MAG TPA: STN domain-containing protein, partial [Prolixibacteraceae bacterium]|nr:STN domain-containing protein [Prolixibacteraceae bacterium]
MTISILSGFASESYSQTARLSLNLENSTIREVLKVIENQSEFRFFYSGEVDVDREISVTVDNKNIMQTLDQLFQGT